MPSLDTYCQRLRELAGLLKDVDAEISSQRLVLQLVRDLPSEFDTVAALIHQQLPDFETARNMLELEQSRISNRDESAALVAPAPSPPVEPPSWPPESPASGPPPPRPSGKNKKNGRYNQNPNQNFNRQSNRPVFYSSQPWGPPPPWVSNWSLPPCPYPTYPGWAAPWPQQQPRQQPTYRGQTRPPTPQSSRGYGQVYMVDEEQQPTDLGQAFQAMSMNSNDGQWFMDTGASSHLTSDPGFNE